MVSSQRVRRRNTDRGTCNQVRREEVNISQQWPRDSVAATPLPLPMTTQRDCCNQPFGLRLVLHMIFSGTLSSGPAYSMILKVAAVATPPMAIQPAFFPDSIPSPNNVILGVFYQELAGIPAQRDSFHRPASLIDIVGKYLMSISRVILLDCPMNNEGIIPTIQNNGPATNSTPMCQQPQAAGHTAPRQPR